MEKKELFQKIAGLGFGSAMTAVKQIPGAMKNNFSAVRKGGMGFGKALGSAAGVGAGRVKSLAGSKIYGNAGKAALGVTGAGLAAAGAGAAYGGKKLYDKFTNKNKQQNQKA